MTDHVVFVCKACGCANGITPATLTKYPNGPTSLNQLGLSQITTCQYCDFAQSLPDRSQSELDEYYASGQYWEGTENRFLEAHQKVQAGARLQRLIHLLPARKALRVLDVGAGLGFLGDELAFWAKQSDATNDIYYCASEPDARTASRASDRLSTRGLKFNVVRSLSESDQAFDLIFLNHVLEHVHDPVGFLRSLKEKLANSGHIYVEVPHRDDRYKQNVFPHVLFFSQAALAHVAKRAGFNVNFCEPFGATDLNCLPALQRFGAKIYRTLCIRLFNIGVRRDWPMVFAWANRRLYSYKKNSNGMWLRSFLTPS